MSNTETTYRVKCLKHDNHYPSPNDVISSILFSREVFNLSTQREYIYKLSRDDKKDVFVRRRYPTNNQYYRLLTIVEPSKFELEQETINHEEKISPQELSRQAKIRKQSFSVQEGLGLLVSETVGRESVQEGMF